ncbi:hypothetical protein PR001_g17817 [Phytophthora rubi]|uniref:DDE-1 domain-containing protein n=1 Tax=Phytophthora rubi TaxID=129364 RepID=A0A6A3KE84_9STRA|nr:hypothetical protein PR001_g17817 [Phytophthora rubi]
MRYGIRWRRAYGELGEVELEEVVADFQRLRRLIRQYASKDVYNMDETGFHYNQVLRGSLCLQEAPTLKQDKSRITLALCCNTTGSDKRSLLFVGKAVKPRWLNDKPHDVEYKSA